MGEQIKVIQLSAEGITQAFIAKGDIPSDVMTLACQNQFKPSQYEDAVINLNNAKIIQGFYRWVPATDEYGEPCGSRLIAAEKAGKGSFFATELVLS